MKAFACVLLLAAFVAAEPPRYRLARFRYERQELGEGGEKEATTPKAEEAPYPASGFKPSKEFKLPSRQEVAPPATSYGIPDDSYGAPLRTYVAPPSEYGVPEPRGNDKKEGEEKSEKPEKEEKEGGESEVESLKTEGKEKKGKLEEEPKKEAEVVSNQGAYYVLLPGSQLQRVQFQTESDIRNMAYTARLQYREEDRAPLFVYTAVPQYQSSAYVQLI
ncbi:neurofilament heavy polypeptide-like [Ostrinia furnacalis]|uniref:neurofilament heavy polypeptide-like n=1 Tax=Ostrinia furnacalis TaxID=93504 RepID=UPI00103B8566|nr:neurofilament heavy polypeptide-like [Ostrinia furnacalis]